MISDMRAPLTSLTSTLSAPASSEFSTSSFTAVLTDVITCELAIRWIVDEGSRFKEAISFINNRTTRIFTSCFENRAGNRGHVGLISEHFRYKFGNWSVADATLSEYTKN